MNKEQNRMIKKEGKSLEKKTNKPKTNKQKKNTNQGVLFSIYEIHY